MKKRIETLKALIVEDSEDDAILLVSTLESNGIRLEWRRVDTEQEFMDAVEERGWEIVFSDYSMPKFSGLAALTLLRKHDPDLPFIFVSGTIGEETAVEAMRNGAQDYVMKDRLARLVPAVERELEEAERRREIRASDERHQRLIAILEATTDFVAISDGAGNLLYLNSGAREVLGISPDEEIDERDLSECYPPWALDQLLNEALPASRRDGAWEGESVLRSVDGKEIPVSLVVLAHNDESGNIAFYSTIARDLSDRKHFEAELHYQATHDILTGLANRLLLGDRLDTEISRAKRQRRMLAVVFLDLNNFKRINDSLGHIAGDAVLREVAHRLLRTLRPSDMVARYGGDEFVVVAGDITNIENVISVINKLRDIGEQPVRIGSDEVFTGFSMGVAMYPDDGEDWQTLLKNADSAMYRAKEKGGQDHRFYAPGMNERSHQLLSLETDLRRALKSEEFRLYYQPQVNIATGAIVGVEALLRWQHHERGLVSPVEFVPLLEETGLIVNVGEWVLQQACSDFRRLAEIHSDIRVAVNVAARQFNEGDLVKIVERAMKEERIPRDRLEIEITEDTVMQDIYLSDEVLEALDRIGVRLAVDDFGTGYSSLSYLKRFPLNALKIDKIFIEDLPDDENDAAITESSIFLAHRLGLEVVAEGVETQSQWQFLKSSRCDLVQGYYISRPAPIDACMAMLKARKIS